MYVQVTQLPGLKLDCVNPLDWIKWVTFSPGHARPAQFNVNLKWYLHAHIISECSKGDSLLVNSRNVSECIMLAIHS